MTKQISIRDLDDSVAKAIGIAIASALDERIAALEERINSFTFTGPWSEEGKYKRGNFASCGGAVFFCSVDGAITKPGQSNEWILAVPRARDGRDGKDFTPPDPPDKRAVHSQRQNGARR